LHLYSHIFPLEISSKVGKDNIKVKNNQQFVQLSFLHQALKQTLRCKKLWYTICPFENKIQFDTNIE